MGALEAIKYSDGKLQLLDQRLLPLETVYLDVPDPQAAWQQIKVREPAGASGWLRIMLKQHHV
jgi:methylthioribose-1-phosphate isomerase